ncbi:lycopene cyclase family protein [Nannocystaceae bacterium ST9]
MIEPFDLCVAGTGPAGLSLAAACADRRVRVALIGPEPERPWPNNYGLWLDDAERLGLADQLAARWPRTEVILRGAAIDLGRGYARIANDRMQSDALARCRSGGVVFHEGHVDTLVHLEGHTRVQLREGPAISARLFVDATGHGSPLVEREPGPEPGYQVAWGELRDALPTELARSPELMRFMDWTPSGAPEDGLPPSFLYCMPLADERVFVEETVLVGRPGAGGPSAWFEPLRARLHARLPSLATRGDLIETERCVIPMGGPLPRRGQRTLAFGAAAGFVHPATGYMLGVALHRLARVAEAIAEVAREPSTAIDRACARVERAIWTADERRTWQLYGFGMQVLLELDHAGIEEFFAEFFALPPERWRGFLSATAPSSTSMATMLRYFGSTTPAIRRRLSAHLFGRDGLRLARGLLGRV